MINASPTDLRFDPVRMEANLHRAPSGWNDTMKALYPWTVPCGWRGWVNSDVEKQWFVALDNADADQAKATEAFVAMKAHVDTLAMLRPGCQTILWGYPRVVDPVAKPAAWAVNLALMEYKPLVAGICPSIYVSANDEQREGDFRYYEKKMKAALSVNAKVYPVVWGWAHSDGPMVGDLVTWMDRMVEVACKSHVTFNGDERSCDGIHLWRGPWETQTDGPAVEADLMLADKLEAALSG